MEISPTPPNNPQCSNIGDCGQLGIYGSNLVCTKTGYCQNCQSDLDCNGVDTPVGKCINNVCSCVNDNDCSCEGNDPYGCGQDDNAKCGCSPKYKGLSDINFVSSSKNLYFIIGICLLLMIFWTIYVLRFSKLNKKFLIYGNLFIGMIFGSILIVNSN